MINKKSQKHHSEASVTWHLYDVPQFEEYRMFENLYNLPSCTVTVVPVKNLAQGEALL